MTVGQRLDACGSSGGSRKLIEEGDIENGKGGAHTGPKAKRKEGKPDE